MSFKNVQQENNYNESPKSVAENCDTNLQGKKLLKFAFNLLRAELQDKYKVKLTIH